MLASTRWKRPLASFAIVLSLSATGCVGPGAKTIERERPTYIDSLSLTDKQELLANIVRLRYNEPPVFLKVDRIASNVSKEYEVDAEAEIAEFAGVSFGDGSISPGYTYKQNPTIFYEPLSGKTFANELLVPFEPLTVFLMLENGFRFDVIAELMFDGMNDVSNSRHARPQDRETFRSVARSLTAMFAQRTYEVAGIRDGNLGSGEGELVLQRNWDRPMSEATLEAFNDLGLNPEANEITVVRGRKGDADTIAIHTRSLLSTMSYLSNYVVAPSDHYEIVWPSFVDPDENTQFAVTATNRRPNEAGDTAIQFMDHWFVVRGNDLSSNNTLYLLRILFNLQAQSETDPSRGVSFALPLN